MKSRKPLPMNVAKSACALLLITACLLPGCNRAESQSAAFSRTTNFDFSMRAGEFLEFSSQSADVEFFPVDATDNLRIEVVSSANARDAEAADAIFDTIDMEFTKLAYGVRGHIRNGQPGLRWLGLIRVYPSTSIKVFLPPNLRVQLTTGAGNVAGDNLSADFVIATGSGNVRLKHLSGDFKAKTGSGNFFIDHFAGSLLFESGSGNLQAHGSINAFNAQSGSGKIQIQTLAALSDDSRARSGSGNIHLIFPQICSFALSAASGSGKIAVNLDPFSPAPDSSSRSVAGFVRSNSPALNVFSGSGNIRIENP